METTTTTNFTETPNTLCRLTHWPVSVLHEWRCLAHSSHVIMPKSEEPNYVRREYVHIQKPHNNTNNCSKNSQINIVHINVFVVYKCSSHSLLVYGCIFWMWFGAWSWEFGASRSLCLFVCLSLSLFLYALVSLYAYVLDRKTALHRSIRMHAPLP